MGTSTAFALFTSDPNLIACQLDRLSGQVLLEDEPGANALGVGVHSQQEVLLRRLPSAGGTPGVGQLWSGPEAAALLFHSRRLPLGMSIEDNTQPFRFKHWMFAHRGNLRGFDQLRPKLIAGLPDYLRRHVAGDTDSELAFALFLKHLRDRGRQEEWPIDPAVAAAALGATGRMLAQQAAEAGSTRTSTLDFLATEGTSLFAMRSEGDPLWYRLLEGAASCARCDLSEVGSKAHPLAIAHQRCKAVAVASRLQVTEGWHELPAWNVLVVHGQAQTQLLPV